jgi:hypothetical protein
MKLYTVYQDGGEFYFTPDEVGAQDSEFCIGVNYRVPDFGVPAGASRQTSEPV